MESSITLACTDKEVRDFVHSALKMLCNYKGIIHSLNNERALDE